MKCLCCGKPLTDNESNGWHRKCIRRFFNANELPLINMDNESLRELASHSVSEGYTVAGVQKKMSLHLSKEGKDCRLTIVGYPAGYILKPQVEEYRALPQAEHLVMSMADVCGIKTVPHALILKNGIYSYITRRVDRVNETRLAMEDFCQLSERVTADKYKGSYEQCANVIKKYSSQIRIDMAEFYLRLVFCFVTGNSDMHLKNFSLIEGADGYKLSEAYDLLPVNVIMPNDQDETALTLGGKKKNLTRRRFLELAEHCDLSEKVAENMIRQVLKHKEQLLEMCAESLMPDDMKEDLAELIKVRCAILEK